LYADTYGMDVFCLRIGSSFDVPFDLRSLSTWMSPDDTARLVEACLATDRGGYRLIWGVSPNTRRWWSPESGEEIGYHPVDDSEVFADKLIGQFGEPDPNDPVHRLVGGKFCAVPLGERME
jgi:uronate dehydrogenase